VALLVHTLWAYSGAVAVNAGLAALGGGAIAAGGLGMAGGAALVTGLFGAAGAGLAGYKMSKRTGAIQEFSFELLGGKGMHTFIAVSGWLSEKNDFSKTWEALNQVANGGERYALRWESKHLLALGKALGTFTTQKVTHAAVKAWAMRASRVAAKAVRWPSLVLDAFRFIDNPWSIARDRAEKGGRELALLLKERVHGHRPVTLIGFSLGSRLIFHALEALAEEKALGIVDHAILMGSAVTAEANRWNNVRPVVAGRLVNAYSISDWVLGILYRTTQMTTQVAGLSPIDSPHVENVDVTHIARGHLDYHKNVAELLTVIGVDGVGSV